MLELQNLFGQYALYAWLVLLGLVFLSLYWVAGVRRRVAFLAHRYGNLTKGVDPADLLDAVDQQVAEVQHLAERVEGVAGDCQRLDERLQLSLHRVGLIRYNPFDDTGGDQSFALALLDEHEDGIVISSIFSRTGSRLYAKPVKSGKSKYTLSAEEEKAIVQAALAR